MKAEILPLKTAAEVWAQSGRDMWLYRWTREGLAQLQGKGPRCAMMAAEYWAYERMKSGGPVSMLVVDAEEEGQWDSQTMRQGEIPAVDDLQRIYASLETSLTEVAGLITSAQQTLSVDDYGDALAGALQRLELCVRCVRDLQRVPDNQTVGQSDNETDDDLEALDDWHKAEAEACVQDLLRGVPVEGGNASRNDLRNLILSGFLSGAVEQLTRPFVRQPKTGGPDAA